MGRLTDLLRITLLEVDVIGRTQLNRLMDGASQHRADLPGASRVVLDERCLYRYSHSGQCRRPAFRQQLIRCVDGDSNHSPLV